MANYDINKVIEIAKKEVGYLEKKNNNDIYDKTKNAGDLNYNKYAYEFDTKYKDFYNGAKNHYAAWCDIFVDWCLVTAYGEAAALAMIGQPKKSYGAGCSWSIKYYQNIGSFYKTNPKVGDQIFFKDSSGEPCHTGLVVAVDGSKVYTIEGNTSSAAGVVANGGAVAEKSYALNYSRIYGYGRPKYGDQSSFKKVATTTKSTTKINAKVKEFQNAAIADGLKKYLPSGADGEWGKECETVASKNLCYKRLIGYKYPNLTKIIQKAVGVTADGKFGNDTKKAVQAFQKKHGLGQDGIVGIKTWKAICGIK